MAEPAGPDEARRSPLLGGLVWAVGLGLAALHLWGARSGQWFGGDEAKYVGLALSLGSGAGYATNGAEHAVYPPGYPLALVPATTVVGLDPPALTHYSVVLSLLALGALWWYLRRRRDVGSPWVYPVLMLGSVGVFRVFTDLRAEGFFVLVLALLLAGFEVLARDRPDGEPLGTPARVTLVALCLVGGALLPSVRAVGIALPAALVVSSLLAWLVGRRAPSRSWQAGAVATFVGAAVYQGWWWRREAAFGDDRSYMRLLSLVDPHRPDLGTAGLGHVVVRLLDNTALQLSRGVELLTNVDPIYAFISGFPQVVVGILVGWGLFEEARRPNPLAGWFLLAYVGVVVLWPFDEGTRFLVPVLPLLVLFAGRGVLAAWEAWPGEATRWRRLGFAALVGALCMGVEWRLRGSSSVQGLLWMAFWLGSAGLAFLGARLLPARPRFELRHAGVAWVVAFLVLGAPTLVEQARRQRSGEEKFQAARIAGAAVWIASGTRSDDVIGATAEAQALHLHTGRFTRELPATADTTVLWGRLDESGARYLVVPIDHEYPYLLPTGAERFEILDAARPGRLELVHTYAMGRIFEIRSP